MDPSLKATNIKAWGGAIEASETPDANEDQVKCLVAESDQQ